MSRALPGGASAPLIRVLIADDSSFMRAGLSHILGAAGPFAVVGTAQDGAEAVRSIGRLRPDIVLLDLNMPGMDGLAVLRHIMRDCPTRVVMISGLASKHPELVLRCLEEGAIDFIAKPSGSAAYDLDGMRDDIAARLKAAASVDLRRLARRAMRPPMATPARAGAAHGLIVIGASTGGPRALSSVLAQLPRDLPAGILVVQHMTAEFLPYFVERLRSHCQFDISLARDGGVLGPGRAVVARSGCRMALVPDGPSENILRLSADAAPSLCGPSIDHAMKAAAGAVGEAAIGVLLTGQGSDGALGMQAIKNGGGRTIAEAEESCIVFGMPKAAIALGVVDRIVPLPQIAQGIVSMM